MPRRRDRIRDLLFNRSRNPSPTPPGQQNLLSQADSSSAISLVPTSSSNPLTRVFPSAESKEMASVAWEGVKIATVLLKESSDWFPPLKAATGGFIASIDAIEVSETYFSSLASLSDLTS